MISNHPTPSALAENFQVAELEPRLENAWSNMSGDTTPPPPSNPDGTAGSL